MGSNNSRTTPAITSGPAQCSSFVFTLFADTLRLANDLATLRASPCQLLTVNIRPQKQQQVPPQQRGEKVQLQVVEN